MSGLATLYFPAGVLIGMASAAPVGPVNLLVIQRSVTAHTASALVLGAAGAAGDAVFAAAAAFGMTAVAQLLAEYALVLRFGGGAIMLAFAIFIWQSTPRLRGDGGPASIVRMTLAVLTLTLTNPATILFFVAAFGAVGFTGIGHGSPDALIHAGLVVTGTFTGSMLWWLLVTGIARKLRGRITDHHLRLLNRGTAVALGMFAIAAVVSGVTAR